MPCSPAPPPTHVSTPPPATNLQVFWAACHVRPQLFNVFLARCLPPPGVDASAQWTRIAHESLPLISDGEVRLPRCHAGKARSDADLAAEGWNE